MRHIHLDLVGGLAGDMFTGALLDCFPDLGEHLPGLIDAAGFRDLVSLRQEATGDGVLTGTRFDVSAGADAEGHDHRHYTDIRARLESAPIPDTTRHHALAIFHEIAVVEAAIHGKQVEKVAFHEVGAWDSIADILCAAHLIGLLGASWSVSRIPIGRGRVRTAHGPLPVPAPATARLLEGFEFVDDGVEGERVTPTGAAILKHLAPSQGIPRGAQLERSGYGFGTKTFTGLSNVTRAMVFSSGVADAWETDQVLALSFEVDDQSPESLAVAVARLREEPGVIDVVHVAMQAKKDRQTISVRVLADPAREAEVLARCFSLTTTLGVRKAMTGRAILRRHERVVSHDGNDYRVKLAERPGGMTAKVELDDLVKHGGDRTAIEHAALAQFREQDKS